MTPSVIVDVDDTQFRLLGNRAVVCRRNVATPTGADSAGGARKLLLLDQARRLDDLRSPPGNRLEALKGDRAGQHSIRINDQWRICFRWQGSDAFDVEIVDYH